MARIPERKTLAGRGGRAGRRAGFLAVAVLFALAGACLAAGVRLCGKCGHEDTAGGDVCAHCSAALPPAAAEAAAPSPEAPAPAAAPAAAVPAPVYLPESVVVDEVNEGLSQAQAGDFGVAVLLLRNAAALEMLTEPGSGSRGRIILAEIKRYDVRGMTAKRPCETCKGSGNRRIRREALDSEVEYLEIRGRACPDCGGRGWLLRAATIGERLNQIGRSQARYTTVQQARKFVPLGGAWLPAEWDGKLAARQRAILKRTTAAPCPECLGLGQADCPRCRGQGNVTCASAKCRNGLITETRQGELVKGSLRRSAKCPVCEGKGVTACSACRGAGSITCQECKGAGARPICRRCGGQGFSDCRDCTGTGTRDGRPCRRCGGAGCIECGSCGGDGRSD